MAIGWECGACGMAGTAPTVDAAYAALGRHVQRRHPQQGRAGVGAILRPLREGRRTHVGTHSV